MELVQIISEILIYGGLLLIVVIAISFLLSRKKKELIKNSMSIVPSVVITNRSPIVVNQNQVLQRRNIQPQTPIVYQIDPRLNRDIRILRKPTVTKEEIQERIRQDENSFKRTNGYKKRYTIINEEINKTFKPDVINF